MSEPAIATDFRASVIEEIERQARSENVQQLIAKKVNEVMTETITSAFRTYGDVGKQIEVAVKDSLKLGGSMDLPAYGVMVMALLRQKLDEKVHALVANRLDQEMNDILSIAPNELKFSALVEAIIQVASEDMDDRYGTHITCIVEEREAPYNWVEVWLEKNEKTDKRDCEIRFTVSKDGTVLSIRVEGKDPKTTVRMGPMWGYQKMIFGAYCCGSKIIMDEMDPSTVIGDF